MSLSDLFRGTSFLRPACFLAAVALGITLSIAIVLADEKQNAEGVAAEKWRDVSPATEKELGSKSHRLSERPGNYQALEVIADYFEGSQALRPELRRSCFPHWCHYGEIKDAKAFEKMLKDREEGTRPTNELRRFNLNIKSLAIDSYEANTSIKLDKDTSENFRDWVKSARKHHKGRALVVSAKMTLESVVSPKEREGTWHFLLVRVDDKWKVAVSESS